MGADSEMIERLAAESEIQSVLLRYVRGIDRLDLELVRECYHPDAIDEHGAYSGGVDGFIAYLEEALPQFESMLHFSGPALIELDGDRAWVESYCLSLGRLASSGDLPLRERHQTLRYCDRFERRDGAWKIAHRIAVWGAGRIDPVLEEAELTDAHHRDRRDRSDPAYLRHDH